MADLTPLSLAKQWQITLTSAVCQPLGWDSERPLLAVPTAYAGEVLALRPARYLLLIEPSVLTQALQENAEMLGEERGDLEAPPAQRMP